ncbi:MAG: succinic semialdehyde dehydrogenase [Actinomycetales bacterium]
MGARPGPERRIEEGVASARRLGARLGGLVASRSGDTAATIAPWTGLELARIPVSTPDDVAEAAAGGRRAQPAWAATTPHERAAVLLRFHDLVLDRQDEVLDLVQLESGKARLHAFEEVADVALVARHYGLRGPGLLADRRRPGLFPLLTRVQELRHPRGLVGIISPWNYPLSLGIGDALPALLAGNAVLTKPDTQTALTALWAVDLLHEAGLPRGVLQVVVGDGPVVGGALVEAVDFVTFTGSTPTGRAVAARAGERLIGATLELGGKNALVVLHDADLERAAEGAVRACFSSAGQLCISAERLLVDAGVADEFTERFLQRVRRLQLGGRLDYDVEVGSLVGARQLARVETHVQNAVAGGARLLAGGRPRPDLGPYFYEPTVLTGVTPEMDCYAEETFGPVVSLSTFRGEDEAVARANETAFGLNASVWSRDIARAQAVARRLRVGTVNVNEAYGAAWGSVAAPMGGWGESGQGRRHGEEGLLAYTEPQTIAVARLGLGVPPGMTGRRWARTLTLGLRTLRRLGRP